MIEPINKKCDTFLSNAIAGIVNFIRAIIIINNDKNKQATVKFKALRYGLIYPLLGQYSLLLICILYRHANILV